MALFGMGGISGEAPFLIYKGRLEMVTQVDRGVMRDTGWGAPGGAAEADEHVASTWPSLPPWSLGDSVQLLDRWTCPGLGEEGLLCSLLLQDCSVPSAP